MAIPARTTQATTGVETDPAALSAVESGVEEAVVESLSLPSQHLKLIQVMLADTTDRHNELVHEREWLLHPSDRNLSLSGNLFVIEDLANGCGKVLVRESPLPHARPVSQSSDLRVTARKGSGFDVSLLDTAGLSSGPWAVLDYQGGRVERTRVLHAWQQQRRPGTPGHACPRFLSNTWGDRSRDGRIQDAFIEAEIEAAQRLGVDVVQLDDGWQQGTTSNSAYAKEKGGVWEGFWAADPEFWEPHPDRLRNGLEPVVTRAKAKGMDVGLWFAPDSWSDYGNWRKDAERILELFNTLGIVHFKIDGVKAPTALAAENLQRFFTMVLDGSRGEVVFDLDITAGIRPGYFGALGVGPLFLENRYTDWHNYWPHQTLRNLWKLSHWVDPRRLRMEFLNNTRNLENYADDPLAPVNYAADTLFAMVMFSNPLGWFEVSNLPSAYLESVASLVQIWKAHRQDLFSGTIFPIGAAPDGFSCTGFVSLSEECGYAVVFRGLSSEPRFSLDASDAKLGECDWEVLAPGGGITSSGQQMSVHIPEPLGYVFGRFTRC
ncbi:MAG: hypothetical protein HN742_10035 [Lentisphaerae bacterium]|jgi:alpha-galactosidase|nr:hypothetical protein [Lentisphaerota bacterium]MBT4821664.1 hypothetical protein [Lentisphaerota bacterium]MBT5610409.1 hypothetical protein [Lentisphaerota bacterium]MBT7060186.1 hypothetical protein [Lentisphaerota bacterium]MBT7842201.1 hypothetical protein [Lentisphaerota bacterium]